MTLLTMNAAIVAAIEEYEKISGSDKDSQRIHLNEPSLYNPKIGNPISHQQLIALHDILGSHYPIDGNTINLYRLDQLLRGSRIYTQPKVKEAAKVTLEFECFMDSLRRESEARKYQQMLHSSPENMFINKKTSDFSANDARLSLNSGSHTLDDENEITFADLRRQIALIINVLVSVIACAIAIWVVSRWWDTPIRLALSISGGMLVAVAEVVIYGAYLRRIAEAKRKEQTVIEKKEILDTWLLQTNDQQVNTEGTGIDNRSKLRERKNGT